MTWYVDDSGNACQLASESLPDENFSTVGAMLKSLSVNHLQKECIES